MAGRATDWMSWPAAAVIAALAILLFKETGRMILRRSSSRMTGVEGKGRDRE